MRDPRRLQVPIEKQLDQAAEEVTRRLAGRIGYQTVRRTVTDAYRRLSAQAKVHGFLPILAARSADRTLRSG
ncbi:three-helix bundle dimerization domain-containing protein [Actinosynnema sp. NPDC053489]|uniref:three-helix bundle dimerization domain-containing protein n=1 Tax=Actinosynnema sp. NPDC053489 TaxID=3363916 RepID=UPI0037CAFD27